MEDHKNARFFEADFGGARFHGVNFSNVKISDAWLFNVDVSGLVGNLTVNGVDVSAYVGVELNRLHPERLLLVPTDPDGVRAAWEDGRSVQRRNPRAGPHRSRRTSSTNRSTTNGRTSRRSAISCSPLTAGSPVRCSARRSRFIRWACPTRRHSTRFLAGMFDLDASPTLDEVLGRAPRPDAIGSPSSCSRSTRTSSTVRWHRPTAGRPPCSTACASSFREEWWHDQYARRDLAILASR